MLNMMIDIKTDKRFYEEMTDEELNKEKYRLISCLALTYKMRDVTYAKKYDDELHTVLKEIKRRKNKDN